jgi:hypothetical protein
MRSIRRINYRLAQLLAVYVSCRNWLAHQPCPNFPHNPNNVFDNTLPRGLFYLVIDHFFDYLHALNPFVHRPTFVRDILDRREENAGQEEWVAMVLAVISLTILQLPPSFIPVPVAESRRIAYTCYRHARGYSLKDYEHLSLDRRESLYFACDPS